jgi:hypothetical protein
MFIKNGLNGSAGKGNLTPGHEEGAHFMPPAIKKNILHLPDFPVPIHRV